jgi:predicted amidophosphoribosyltransferase
MLCEKCSQEIETVVCGRCGNAVIELGRFCYHCGRELHGQGEPSGLTQGSVRDEPPDAIDFSTRVLCSDGNCIGVIDEHGVCRVCGKPYTPES